MLNGCIVDGQETRMTKKPKMNERSASVDDIVISGISGRFPKSNNVEEFKDNLFKGVDLTAEDQPRWRPGLYGLPTRSGKIKDLHHFDASFFGVHGKEAQVMDPQLRLLLETTYEAIVDAGVNPAQMRGSKTGVFIGTTTNESIEHWKTDIENDFGYCLPGGLKAMFSNRISYAFDFTGPSVSLDTACSASLVALQSGVAAIKSGECDAAIVGGCIICLDPQYALQFKKMGMTSSDGKCRVFDEDASGYVRSESVSVAYLQKSSVARRIYATILGIKTNNDGYKKEGVTYPSSTMQARLMQEVLDEACISPEDVTFVEAHSSGTKAGDPQEVNAIAKVYCINRTEPLLIGSVKSNMGHSESGAGMCSLAKVIIAMESGFIPGNLFFEKPTTNIPGLTDGRLKVVTKREPWTEGIAAINSVGFGGSNANALLRHNIKPKAVPVTEAIPRVVTVSGRTEEIVTHLLEKVRNHINDGEFLALLDEIHSIDVPKHDYRGYCILNDGSQEIKFLQDHKRPIWFIYSGIGSQYPRVAKYLMRMDTFRTSINKISGTLSQYGIDLVDLLENGDEESLENITNAFVTIMAIQIGLTDVLKSLGIAPDGIIGHSFGETGCGYADGSFTAEQSLKIAYLHSRAIIESDIEPSGMAAVGLTWQECKQRCPHDIFPACHNGENSVTVSGPIQSLDTFIKQLQSENIFARVVKSFGCAFHSKYTAAVGPRLKKVLEEVVPNPKERTSKWVSSSILEPDWQTPLARLNSPDYHVNSFLEHVYFHEAVEHIPKNAIVIEIAPHCIFGSILKKSLGPNSNYVGLTKRDQDDHLQYFLTAMGRLYNAGAQPKIGQLYQPVLFPVGRGTPMISSLVEWDHATEWAVADFSKKGFNTNEEVISISLDKEEHRYLMGHSIDGRIILPTAAYLVYVWKAFARLENTYFEQLPVVIENLYIHRTIEIPNEGSLKLSVNIFESSGEFEICENGLRVVSGKISVADDVESEYIVMPSVTSDAVVCSLTKNEVYKEFCLRGYEYSGLFCSIDNFERDGLEGKLCWEKDWISFIDGIFQFEILGQITRQLCLPLGLQRAFINPASFLELPKKTCIDINTYHKLGVIKSGGIELQGLKTMVLPRQKLQLPPRLETYSFVPAHRTLLAHENHKDLQTFLATTAQIILENINDVHIKIAELSKSRFGLVLKSILELENVIVDYTVFASQGDFEDNVHLVIINSLENFEPTQRVLDSNSFLLVDGFDACAESRMSSLSIVYTQTFSETHKTYALLRKSFEVEQDPIIFPMMGSNIDWVEPAKDVMKENKHNRKIYLVCHDEQLSCMLAVVNYLKHEPGGNNIRAYFIENTASGIFDLNSPFYTAQLKKDLCQNILNKDGVWGTFRYLRLDASDYGRMAPVEHAYLDVIKEDLPSLGWVESPLGYYRSHKGAEFCFVYYAALSESVAAASYSPSYPIEGGQVGLEFSGRNRSGKRVMGIARSGSWATTCVADAEFIWDVPDEWSLEEAATIPVAYVISYYALIIRGQLLPGESVLIHVESSGIGLAAISIALNVGCVVFATAANQSEQKFLQQTFPQLNVNCIGNSNDTSFEQLVMEQTDGRGVDLILLVVEFQLRASARCLALEGRLLNLQQSELSRPGMNALVKGSTYHSISISLTDLLDIKSAIKREVVCLVRKGITNGVVKPLPRTVYTYSDIQEKFTSITTSANKVLLKICEEGHKPNTVMALRRIYFNPEKSFILVDPLVDFGFELIHWLISRGAKKIVVISHSSVEAGYEALWKKYWLNKGINISVPLTYITTEKEAEMLLDEVNMLGPIGGIFSLRPLYENCGDVTTLSKIGLNTEKYLDTASRKLAPSLEYFVTFSHVPCTLNQAVSNFALQRICEDRQLHGLPGLAIQWGPIEGVVVEKCNHSKRLLLAPQSVSSCLETLETSLQQPHSIVVSTIVEMTKCYAQKGINHVAKTIARLLYCEDLENVSKTASLSDLGMDSITATEVQERLKKFGIFLTPSEIRKLTFTKLMEFDEVPFSVVN